MTVLRVAHVLNSPGQGGVPRVAHALVRHCDPLQVSPHVFYLKPGAGADLFEDMDIPRRCAGSGSKTDAMTDLIAWLEQHRIDILHTHSFRPNLYARMAGALLRPAGLKIFAHYHNQYDDKWRGDILTLERHLAAHTDASLAVSCAVAGHVKSFTGLAPHVLENGIDRDRVTGGDRVAGRALLGLPESGFVVGLVGRICHQKGVDTFLESALHLVAQRQDLHCVIVGHAEDGELSRSLQTRINASGHARRITLKDHSDQIADVFAALDVLAAPSRWEGFGLCVAEAMCAGVPVVASNVGGLPQVVGDAGLLVPPDDATALGTALDRLLADTDMRMQCRAAGVRRAAGFDWDRTASRLTKLYDQALGGSP